MACVISTRQRLGACLAQVHHCCGRRRKPSLVQASSHLQQHNWQNGTFPGASLGWAGVSEDKGIVASSVGKGCGSFGIKRRRLTSLCFQTAAWLLYSNSIARLLHSCLSLVARPIVAKLISTKSFAPKYFQHHQTLVKSVLLCLAAFSEAVVLSNSSYPSVINPRLHAALVHPLAEA